MKKGVELLYNVQKHDDQIKEKNIILLSIPEQIKSLEDERDQKSDIINKSKQKLEKNTKDRTDLEKKILTFKEKIKKYNDQMQNCTTNKEYQGFQNEIKYQEDSIKEIEDNIIEKMLESDEIFEEINKSEQEYKSIASTYDIEIAELNKKHTKINQDLENLVDKKELLKKDIPADLVKMYHNLFQKKNGKVISPVEIDFCGICHVKIRPQLLNELISTNQLFFCENCGRVLLKIFPEDKEANQKPKKS